MSIRHVPIDAPPPPPPPPRYEDVLTCDGCGFERLRMDPGLVTQLPTGWFRGWVDKSGACALAERIDLCPRCIPGSAVSLPNGRRIPLENS